MVLVTLNDECIVVKRNDIKDKLKVMNYEQINQRKHVQSKIDEINENRLVLKNKLNDSNNEWSTKKADIQSKMRLVKEEFELQSNKIISEDLTKDEKLMVVLKAREDKIAYFGKLQLLKEELIETNNFFTIEKVKLVEEMSKLKDKEISLKAIVKSIHLQFLKVKDELSIQIAELSGKTKVNVVEVIDNEKLSIDNGNDVNDAMQITESSYGNTEPTPKSSSNVNEDKIEILKLLDSIKSKKQFLSESLIGLNTTWTFNKDRYNTQIKLLHTEFEEFKKQNPVCNGSKDDKEIYRNLMIEAKSNYFQNVENEKVLFKQLSEDTAAKKSAIQDELTELKQQEIYFRNVVSNMTIKPVQVNYNTNNSANSLPVSESVIVTEDPYSLIDYSQSYEEVFETKRTYQDEVNEYKELITMAAEKYKKQFNVLVAMNKQWSNKEIIGLDAIKAFDNKKNEVKRDLKDIKDTLESFKFKFKELVVNHELKKQWELV